MNEERPRFVCGAAGISRRRFCTDAGATAGALAVMGSLAGLVAAPRAEAALKSRRYYAYYVALELDGKYAGLVEIAEGGEPLIDVSISAGATGPTREIQPPRYLPLTLRLADMSPAVYDWIRTSVAGVGPLRSLSVVTASQDLKESYRLLAQNARITSVLLDELDANSGAPARFTLALQASKSAHEFGGKPGFQPLSFKASPLLRSGFLLYIQGLEALAPRIASVGAVQIDVSPQTPAVVVPRSLRFQIPLPYSEPLFQWMNQSLATPIPRAGELQLLSRDRTRVVASFRFTQLLVVRMSAPAQAQNDQQMVEVECVPQGVSFSAGELLT